MSEILGRAHELEDERRAFALATVVAVEQPVSAKPGNKAIVTPDGRIEGWVGGSCSEPIVIREAIAAIADGRARLVRIRQPGAPPEPDRPGVVTQITTCASEGALDVFVEPRLPLPQLVLAGSSPITRTLAKLSKVMGYRVTAAVDDPAESVPGADSVITLDELKRLELRSRDAVVVATMNRYDELALEAALQTEVGYVGLVASKARAKTVLDMLGARGVDESSMQRISSPAGLDLGPSTQEEIALAVMAEVVNERHRRQDAPGVEAWCPPEEAVAEAIDPVCGMKVAVVPGAISAQLGNSTFYFCSPGCREEFLAHPTRYGQAV